MAEILIKAFSNVHRDPEKDQRGCYKRGDIVDVRPDGWLWGTDEGLPKFIIIKMPEINVEDIKHLMETYKNSDIVVRRRLWNIQIDSLSLDLKKDLQTKGIITVTKSKIKKFFQNKKTLETWK